MKRFYRPLTTAILYTIVPLLVACDAKDSPPSSKAVSAVDTQQQQAQGEMHQWNIPLEAKAWALFASAGTPHDLRLRSDQLTLSGSKSDLVKTTACTKQRWAVLGPVQAQGTVEYSLGSDDKWGSVVLNYFGADKKMLKGKDAFAFINISKKTADLAFDKELVPPADATHFQLCLGLKAKAGRLEVHDLVLETLVLHPAEQALATHMGSGQVRDSGRSQSTKAADPLVRNADDALTATTPQSLIIGGLQPNQGEDTAFDPNSVEDDANLVVLGQADVEARVITKINRTRKPEELVMYTPDHGRTSGQTKFGIEVAVEDNLVSAIRPWGTDKALTIPRNGYVLSGNGVSARFLKRFKIGDPVRVQDESECSSQQHSVPVLMYHRLFHEGSKRIVESQFRGMHEAGYTSISMDELAAMMEGRPVTMPEKPIVLTFDDGRREHYTELPNLMEKYDLKAVLFGIGTHLDNPFDRYFGWREAKELMATGRFELMCHSYDAHRHVVDGSGKKVGAYTTSSKDADAQEEARFRSADLNKCRAAYEENLGVTNHHIAWPFGEYDEALVELAADAGFISMVTTEEGINGPGMDPHMVRRFAVTPKMEWSELEEKIDSWRVCPSRDVMASL